MEIFIIAIIAFITSVLTFFSGFGLGTILTPVFMVFFPVDLAIALTGIVHLFNNIFKLTLVGKNADRQVLINFGIPAVIAAFLGSLTLINLPTQYTLISYEMWGRGFEIQLLKLIISVLLIIFALIELLPRFKSLSFGKDKLAIGGLLSGFFGGLSGNQGALRSAFLIKAGLNKETFIGTAVVVSSFVDFTRLGVYFTRISSSGLKGNELLVVIATLSAIIGAFIGHRLLKKITFHFIQLIVAVMLIALSIALGAGWI